MLVESEKLIIVIDLTAPPQRSKSRQNWTVATTAGNCPIPRPDGLGPEKININLYRPLSEEELEELRKERGF